MSSPLDETEGHEAEATLVATGPTAPAYRPGPWEWTVVAISVVIVAVAIYLAIRYLIWPGERDSSHIKRRILRDETP